MKGRKFLATITMVVMMFSFAMTAMATETKAAEPKELKKIYLQVTQSNTGEIRSITAKSSHSEEYDVSYDSQNYWAGEKPIVTVTVTAKTGYVFYNDFSSKSQYSITGGKFWDGWRVNSSTVKVEVECSKVTKGTLDTPTGLYWEEDYGIASWDEVDNAEYYIVRINSNDITVNDTIVNLNQYLRNKRDNKFRVKACSSSSYLTDSAWSDYSEDLYYDKSDWDDYDYWDDYYWDNYPDLPNPPNYNTTTGVNYWVQRGGIWYFYGSNGRLVTNGMYQINGRYYLFDKDGKMLTGRQNWNGNTYYFYPNDGINVEGSMAKGWVLSGKTWFYYDNSGREVKNQFVGDYYVGYDGMVTNKWQGNRYLDESGKMIRNGWKFTYRASWTSYWYYFDANGNMVSDTIMVINGLPYPFDASGRLKYGWFDYKGYSYYIKPDGNVARNEYIENYWMDNYGRWIR